MRLRTPLTLAVLLALSCSAARAQESQKKDEQVIEEFVSTRGVSFEEPGKRTKKQPSAPARRNGPPAGKGSGSAGAASGRTGKGKGGAAVKTGAASASQAAAQPSSEASAQVLKAGGAERPLALGYTILMKDDGDRLSVVDPSREFKTGERFAVALETNADGYLYMFGAENRRDPELLFPNVQVDGGSNAVAAHALATFPTGPAGGEEHVIEFTPPAATEHLFIVFSRRPLAEVPAGEALVKFCGKKLEDCAWRPTAAQWADILRGAQRPGVTEAKNAQMAQAAAPPVTLQRGLKVKREDPRPAVVRVNDTSEADILVTEIVLTHK